MDAPSVFVEVRFGTATYPRCYATQLPNGDLMIKSCDTGDVLNVHQAGSWRVADCAGEYFRAIVPLFPSMSARNRRVGAGDGPASNGAIPCQTPVLKGANAKS